MHIRKFLFIICLAVYSTVSFASAGNWTAVFVVGPQRDHIVEHTPDWVCFDGALCASVGISIKTRRVNELELSTCGLHLDVD